MIWIFSVVIPPDEGRGDHARRQMPLQRHVAASLEMRQFDARLLSQHAVRASLRC